MDVVMGKDARREEGDGADDSGAGPQLPVSIFDLEPDASSCLRFGDARQAGQEASVGVCVRAVAAAMSMAGSNRPRRFPNAALGRLTQNTSTEEGNPGDRTPSFASGEVVEACSM